MEIIDPLPAIQAALAFIPLQSAAPAFSAGQIIALLIALLCLVLSGFVSGSEIAFFSLSQQQLEDLEEQNSRKGGEIAAILAKPEKLLATILIANNLVNVTIVVLCNFALGPVFQGMSEILSFILQTVILTFLILLFGEILPKLYSNSNPVRWASFAFGGIKFLISLFSPLSSILVRSTGFVNRMVTKSRATSQPTSSPRPSKSPRELPRMTKRCSKASSASATPPPPKS